MAKVSFVGFQEKIEIPEGFQLLQIEEHLESKRSRDDLFSLLSDSQQISHWLNEVQSFNSRPGGKMIFKDGSEATCTSFLLGKEVSLISDYFGNFNCKVVKGRDQNSLELNFSILSDDVESKTCEILLIIERLKKLL